VSAPKTAIVTVKLGAELKAKLDALARSTRRSKSAIAAEAIVAYLDLNAWQIAEIEAGIAEHNAGETVSDQEAAARYERLLER
jgi:predicted transcriptional regulator